MKNILVPTDFSDCARAAEDIGLEVAKKASVVIHFLKLKNMPVNCVNLSVGKESLYPETKEEIGLAKYELNELARRAEKMGLKGNCNVYARRTGFLSLFSTSTVEKVTNHPELPVMTIRV